MLVHNCCKKSEHFCTIYLTMTNVMYTNHISVANTRETLRRRRTYSQKLHDTECSRQARRKCNESEEQLVLLYRWKMDALSDDLKSARVETDLCMHRIAASCVTHW